MNLTTPTILLILLKQEVELAKRDLRQVFKLVLGLTISYDTRKPLLVDLLLISQQHCCRLLP